MQILQGVVLIERAQVVRFGSQNVAWSSKEIFFGYIIYDRSSSSSSYKLLHSRFVDDLHDYDMYLKHIPIMSGNTSSVHMTQKCLSSQQSISILTLDIILFGSLSQGDIVLDYVFTEPEMPNTLKKPLRYTQV